MTKTESVVTLKDDFLTIPDAPNYEINSQLVVRNKKTGRLLKAAIRKNRRIYWLISGGKRIGRTGRTFRRQAVAAQHADWFPVPSLGGKYELNYTGTLRNSSTKKILKIHDSNNFFGFYPIFDGKLKAVSLKSLMWEVFGITPPPSSRRVPVPCSAVKNGVRKSFDSLQALARFLAKDQYFSVGAARYHLNKRRSEFGGWIITYAPPDDWTADKELVSKKILKGVGK